MKQLVNVIAIYLKNNTSYFDNVDISGLEEIDESILANPTKYTATELSKILNMETSEMELKVKVMYGDDVIIHCNGNDLVKHLKEILEEKTGIPVDHQRLIFMGRVLNNEKTLEECNVKDRCVLSLVKITVMICSI